MSEGDRLSAGPLHSFSTEPLFLPVITFNYTTLREKDTVVLHCFTKDIGISIRWILNGQYLGYTHRMEVSKNNRTIIIKSVRVEDSGEYECEVSNPASSKRSDSIQVDIKRE